MKTFSKRMLGSLQARKTQLALAVRLAVAAVAAYALARVLHLMLPLWAVLTALIAFGAWRALENGREVRPFIASIAMFLLGFVMDAFEIIFVVIPIVAPPLLAMPGVDPIWLGIMMAVNLQTSYMHPPLGPTLFFLRGVAPPEISTRDIYIGIIPFVVIQLLALVVLWYVPGLATALPHALYGGR